MKILSKLLYKITGNLPCKLIKLDTGPYLERYYLGQLFGVTFYLHRFVSGDSEQSLHNHPWGWGRSVILLGSYLEERAIDLCPHAGISGCITERKRVRWWNVINANTFHQIHDAEPNTWALLFHGKRVLVNYGMASTPKGWGFLERTTLFGTHQGTLFKPFHSSNRKWWLEAPKGRDAGRVSYENR